MIELGMLAGEVEFIKGEVTEEKVCLAKRKVLEGIISDIKSVAEKYPEQFFIIKKEPIQGSSYAGSVGAKIYLPIRSKEYE